MPHYLCPRGAVGEKEESGLNVQDWKGLKHVTGGGEIWVELGVLGVRWAWSPAGPQGADPC